MKKFVKLGFAMALALAFVGCKHEIADPVHELQVLEFTGTPYTELLAGTDGTLGTAGRYVLFGDWPQTIKASDVVINEYVISYMGMFTYYKGSDGAWYAKCAENAYGTNYTYSDSTTVARSSANSYKYFKVEPIKWRILTDSYSGKKLLLAENILTANKYYDYNGDRSIGDATVYPNNYKESRIRAWLNGLSYTVKASIDDQQTENSEFQGRGFLQTAFTDAIRTKIATDTTIDNSARSTNTDAKANQWNSGNNDYACENTTDKVFLLSEQEVTTSDYGFAAYNVYKDDSNGTMESTRIRMTTDYAKANYAIQNPTAGYGGWWWLRSPDWYDSDYACGVLGDGYVLSADFVHLTSGGVCPALCLK